MARRFSDGAAQGASKSMPHWRDAVDATARWTSDAAADGEVVWS
jgi:hypothetical protein